MLHHPWFSAHLLSAHLLYRQRTYDEKEKRRTEGSAQPYEAGEGYLFAGGIRGKIIRAKEEYLDVEVAKGIEITISRLAVNQVLEKRNSSKTK